MNKKYFPILLAKHGEITALERLEQEVKERISPIIELVPDIFLDGWIEKKKKDEETRAKLREKKGLPPIDKSKSKERAYENKLQKSLITHWSFPKNQVLLDFSHCSTTDPKEIWALLEALRLKKVNAIPVITAKSSAIMVDLAARFVIDNDKHICIRLSNEYGGLADKQTLDAITRVINIPRRDIILLFDNSYIVEDNYRGAIHSTSAALAALEDFTVWKDIIVSAGSFPENLNDPPFAPRKEPYTPKRVEWTLWEELTKEKKNKNRIRYSDYGIKHPIYKDVSYSGSASIKYTNAENFVIYRGKKAEGELGNAQYIVHSKELVSSKHYPNEKFSWGDGLIMEYSKKSPDPIPGKPGKPDKRPKSGGAKEWLAIGQNHHLVLIDSLLE